MDLLDVDRLLVLVTVAREGGFSAAARKLGRSQPAVSQAVAALEAELGQRLFAREGRGAVATQAGLVLVEHAERVLEELRVARGRVAALGALALGSLRVGTTDTLACWLLSPVLAAFRASHPAVELAIDTRPSPVIAERVARRELDVGFVAAPLPPRALARDAADRLALEPVASLPDVAILPPGHALAARARIRLEDLARAPLVALDRTTGSRALLEEAFAARGLAPQVAIETSSLEVVKRFVALGLGLAVVPEIAVSEEVRRGALVARPLAGAGRPRSVAIATPLGAPTSPAAAPFVALAREILGAAGREGAAPDPRARARAGGSPVVRSARTSR